MVEIDGFDEFMAELHNFAKLPLPKAVAQPLDMAEDRVRLITGIEEPLRSHSVIDAHINEAIGNIRAARTRRPSIPLSLEGTILNDMGNYGDAIEVWEQALSENPESHVNVHGYANALAGAGKADEVIELIESLVGTNSLNGADQTYLLLRVDANDRVIELAEFYLSDPHGQRPNRRSEGLIIGINRAIALKRLGRLDDMVGVLNDLTRNERQLPPEARAGVAALLGNKEDMFSALRTSINRTISVKELLEFPVFEDYRQDEEFQAFIQENSRHTRSQLKEETE